MTDENSSQKDPAGELSPLQKYLAKHRTDDQGGEAGASAVPPVDDRAALELGAPATPPPSPPHQESHASAATPSNLTPGGFWIRFCATMIDTFLVATLTVILGGGFYLFSETIRDFSLFIVRFVVVFFYFGWFYAERGATPGKMVFGLEILETGTGKRLGYWRSFFRETVGKFISGLLLFLGFIMAGVRTDKRALHDLIFDTRVMRKT